jgi:hypothetical protein
MEKLCAVKDVASNQWVLVGYAEAEEANLVLVRHAYTISAGNDVLHNIFDVEMKVSHHILHISRLWFKKSDIIFAE